MNCTAKHTKYDPSGAEWACPKCGANADQGFLIEEPAETAGERCEKLHDDDVIYCEKCDYTTTGKKFSAFIIKQRNLITCPCCKGKGLIPKKETQ